MPEQAQQLDASKLLEQIFSKNQGDLAKASVTAATPIPGGHATQMPASMMQPQKQYEMAPLDHREVVGAGNARAQGIGNTVTAVLNILGKTETAMQNKKKLEIASGTQQLLTAQQAYDQAEQLYKQNPQNADAKSAMERNKAVMNGILANDKLRKSIAKGMNIDFTDPQANKTPEHEGVHQGKQMAKEHIDYAEQFNQKTPQVMAPNQQAIAAYQAKLAEQKLNTETMKAMIPLISATMRSNDSAANREGRMDVVKLKEAGENARTVAKSEDAWSRLNTQIQARATQDKTKFGYRMAEIGAKGTKELEVFKAKMQAKNSDPTQQLKAFNEFQNKNAHTISSLNSTLTEMQQLRAQLSAKKSISEQDAAGVKELDQNIDLLKNQVKGFQDYTGAMNDYYKFMNPPKGGSDAGGSSSSSSTESKHSISSADTYLDDDTDPDDDEN